MPKKIDPQLRARCVRLVREHQQEYPTLTAAVTVVARQEGISRESVSRWLAQADVDDGTRPGVSSEESAEVKRLKVEVKRLREDNEILRRAAIFFAGEPDPQPSCEMTTHVGAGISRRRIKTLTAAPVRGKRWRAGARSAGASAGPAVPEGGRCGWLCRAVLARGALADDQLLGDLDDGGGGVGVLDAADDHFHGFLGDPRDVDGHRGQARVRELAL